MRRRDALRVIGLGAAVLAGGVRLPTAESGNASLPRPRGRTVRVCYTAGYAGSAHAFATTRKARWVADSLASKPITGVELVPNEPLTEAAVARVHEPAYVTAVRTGMPRALAESQGFAWDPQLWPMVLASNGGVVAAVSTALANGVAGSLSSGLHHARRDRGGGFSTFNGLAIAALHALDHGAKHVLIVDLDAHCGGGTHSLLGTNPAIHQLDVSVAAFDSYQPSGRNTLDLLGKAKFYLPTIERRLMELWSERFDLCLYNAGMDPHEHCPIGGLTGIDKSVLAKRENLVFSWCQQKQLPVAFVLAGGYIGPGLDLAELVDLHRLTLKAASTA